MPFSKILCRLMQERDVSSYKLAKDLSVHVSTVTNWRNGSNPKINHLSSVANYFGVSIDYLIDNNQAS